MREPLVSICVPVYNGVPLLERCLQGILGQTMTDYELLIVDDSSTDGSYERVRALVGHDRRTRIVRNARNLGLVGNWNRCIELARGRFIKFVFQDDVIAPTCLERLAAIYQPGVGLMVCKRRLEFSSDTSSQRRELYERYMQANSLERYFQGQTLITSGEFCELVVERPIQNFVGEPTAVMMPRWVFERVGLFNPDLIQLCDWEMWVRIGVNFGVAVLLEELATFRVHAGGQSARNLDNLGYQMGVLDPLVILHQMLHARVYAPLRAVAEAQPRKLVALKRRFADTAYLASARVRQKTPDQYRARKDLSTWLKIKRNYPKVRWMQIKYIPLRIWFWVLNRVFGFRAILRGAH